MGEQIKPSIETKLCTQCAEVLPFSEFGKDKHKKSGLTPNCKPCRSKASAKRRQNPIAREKMRLASKNYYHANKERAAEKYKIWYENNKEKRMSDHREWSKKHRKQIAERMVIYRQNNPTKRKEWAIANPEKQKAIYAVRSSKKRANSKWVVKPKELHFMYLQPCVYCGSTNEIQIDHVIPIAKGGNHSIGNLAPACKPCNLSKKDKFVTEWKYGKTVGSKNH